MLEDEIVPEIDERGAKVGFEAIIKPDPVVKATDKTNCGQMTVEKNTISESGGDSYLYVKKFVYLFVRDFFINNGE